jgi:hypothetical protein
MSVTTTATAPVQVTVTIPIGTVFSSGGQVANGIVHRTQVSSRWLRNLSFTLSPGVAISSNMFIEMIDALEAVLDHNHTYVDGWHSNCQCNCQCNCNCSRGTI